MTPPARARPPRAALQRGPLSGQVLLLALPMLGEQFLNFLVGIWDTYLAGTISKEATVAVGTAAYLTWFVNLAFSVIGIGAAALVSRAVGAGDRETANRGLNQALWIAALAGAAVCALSIAAAPWLAGFLTRSDEALELCTRFIRIVGWAYILSSVTGVGCAVLRAAGDTVSPMIIMGAVNLVNTAASAALVFGWFCPRLGVDGIALGTLAARCFGGLLTLAVLGAGRSGLRLQSGMLRPQWGTAGRIVRVGVPAGADMAAMALAQLLFIKVVSLTGSGAQATANFAAHVIAVNIEALSYLPALAWGTAAATLVGQFLGADRPARAVRAGHVAALQGAGLGALAGALFFVLAGAIYDVMSNDPAVRAVGVPAFRLMAFAQPFLCVGIVYTSALRGAGDTRTTSLISLLCGLGLRVPIAYLGGVVLQGGLIGAWCGMWADNLTRSALSSARFAHGGWKRIRV